MENNYVIAFLFISNFLCAGAAAIQCSRGERVDTLREGGEACVPCEDFTFMSEDNHSYRTCKTCTFIEDPDVEVFVSLCNRTHDSVILCNSGFYRLRARNVHETHSCEECTECDDPTRECEGYYDTACCDDNQEAVLNSHDVYVCREIAFLCGPGQFFNTPTEECLPCPAGTFMSAHNHTYKECLKCEQLSENKATHAVITRPCSRTAPTLFGCKDGYFRDPTQESLQPEVPCTPCRSCQRSLTECGMFHDAVCDDQNKMTSTGLGNLTNSTVTPEVADMNNYFQTSLTKRLLSCILHCTKDGIATPPGSTAQSESNTRNCLSEADKANTDTAWLRAISCIAMLVVSNCIYIWLMKKYFVGYNVRNKCIRIFIYAVFVFNILSIIMLIINALLESKLIEEQGHWGVVLTAICFVVFILMYVRNDRPKRG